MPIPVVPRDNRFSRASSSTLSGSTAGPAEKFQIRLVMFSICLTSKRYLPGNPLLSRQSQFQYQSTQCRMHFPVVSELNAPSSRIFQGLCFKSHPFQRFADPSIHFGNPGPRDHQTPDSVLFSVRCQCFRSTITIPKIVRLQHLSDLRGATVTSNQNSDQSRIIANPDETIMPGRFTMSADFRRSTNMI